VEIPGASIPVQLAGPCTRPSEVNVTLDLRPASERVVVALYLSEREAQEVAAALNRRELRAALTLLTAAVRAGLRSLFDGQASSRLRVLREAEAEGPVGGPQTEDLWQVAGEAALSWLVGKLLDAVAAAVSRYVQSAADEFAAAARDPACGVTLLVTTTSPAILSMLRLVLVERRSPTARQLVELSSRAATGPLPQLRTRAGFHRA